MFLASSWHLATRKQHNARRISSALACGFFSLVFLTGCEKAAEKNPKSKFEVADDSASSKTGATTSNTSPATSTTNGSSNSASNPVASTPNMTRPASSLSNVASTPGKSDITISPSTSNPVTTPPPSFSPTVTQGADTRSFMSLIKPEQADAKGWMEFLAKTDLAMKDLMSAVQSRQIAEPQFMERATFIAKLKVESSNALLSMAQSPAETDAGLLGKLQGLTQMAGLNDKQAAEDARAFAPEVAKIVNPEMAHQANMGLLMFILADYSAGKLKEAQPILDLLDRAWSDKKLLGLTDFGVANRILSTFKQRGDESAFDSARAKTIAALGDNENIQVAGQVWQLQVMESKEFAILGQLLESMLSGSAEVSVAQFRTALQDFAKTYPSQMTCAFIAKQSIDVEYSGLVDHARVMNDIVKTSKNDVKNPMLKAEIERAVDDFEKRAAILGKPIVLDGLKKLDGQPLDWQSLKGKVVLVDIWATWCKPCIGEFPNMKNIYTQFKDKGFEIVGVSVDDSPADVITFLQKETLPWTVAFSADPTKVGFDTPVAKSLGVTAIPFLVLIDRAGNVVGMHKRGKALEQAVAELVQQ